MSDPLLVAVEAAGIPLVEAAAKHYQHAGKFRRLESAPLYARYGDLLHAAILTVWFDAEDFYLADARRALVEVLGTFDPLRLRIAIRGLAAMPEVVPDSPWSPVAAAISVELEEAWSTAMTEEVHALRE